jgi:hypothetical protein
LQLTANRASAIGYMFRPGNTGNRIKLNQTFLLSHSDRGTCARRRSVAVSRINSPFRTIV